MHEKLIKLQKKINDKNKNIVINQEIYNGRDTSYNFKCLNCSNTFDRYMKDFMKHPKCPYCETKTRRNFDIAKKEIEEKKDWIIILNTIGKRNHVYTDKKELKCKCKICNFEWIDSFGNVKKKKYCPNCSPSKKLTLEKAKENIALRNENLEVLSEKIINSNSKLKCQCKICKQIFEVHYTNLLNSNFHKCFKTNYSASFGKATLNLTKDRIDLFSQTPALLYIIKAYDKEEYFYKIGITTKALEKRFKFFPYKYEIIKIEFLSLYNAIKLEKQYHEKLKDYKYNPKKTFGGHTECFTKIIE